MAIGSGFRLVAALLQWLLIVALLRNAALNHLKLDSTHQSRAAARHLIENAQLNSTVGNIAAGNSSIPSNGGACQSAKTHPGFPDSCTFVRAHQQCQSGGSLDYTTIFFCKFSSSSTWVAYTLLALWLLALFYMLGNTAADYFCPSLQKLSSLLHLAPTVAGVTLLPLGNGAPDVFASIAAFVSAEAGEVGLNSVLGGAVFVTSVVAGLVYIFSAGKSVRLDRYCFIRDVSFFLLALLCLLWILHAGRINLWGATAFLSIYLAYAITVAASEIIRKKASKFNWHPMQSIVDEPGEDEEEGWYCPLVDPDSPSGEVHYASLPQWRWASHVAIYAHQQPVEVSSPRPLWGWQETTSSSSSLGSQLCKLLVDWPLTLPRQLTIPMVEDSRWCRPVAVASATLAPVLLAALVGGATSVLAYVWGLGLGLCFGVLAYFSTVKEHPPRTFVFPWVAGGFLMSIVWFYIIAKELVAVLVSLGFILNVDSAVLGLTVLAWGNSMGDLMANVAMAYNGGNDGAQVAVSGCYAGPMFNTLVGLGASLLLASWNKYPDSFVIPGDSSLYYTIAFLVVGLVWVLALLPSRGMQPNRLLGVGLLALYISFLTFRICEAWGIFSLSG